MKNHFVALIAVCAALACSKQQTRDPSTANSIPPATDPARETNPNPNSTSDVARGPTSTPVSTPIDTPDRRDSNTFVPASRSTDDTASPPTGTAPTTTAGQSASTTDTARAQDSQRSSGSPQSADTSKRTPAATSPDSTVPAGSSKQSASSKQGAASPNAMDQSESENDRKITQEIRQAVMRDGSLSFAAKNVKIITSGGKVTLRGSVKSEQERSTVAAAARRVAGVMDVDDRMEVKP